MLTETDYKEINKSLNIIDQVKEGANPMFLTTRATQRSLNLLEYLEIASYILLTAKDIFYNSSGKPKNFMQIVGSIGKIIAFVRTLVRMINGKNQTPNEKKAKSATEAIESERRRSLKDDSQN